MSPIAPAVWTVEGCKKFRVLFLYFVSFCKSHDNPVQLAFYSISRIQAHVHADKDVSKIGATLWGRKGAFEGAVAASQVLATSDMFGELGARYNIAPDFFVGAKIDTNPNV